MLQLSFIFLFNVQRDVLQWLWLLLVICNHLKSIISVLLKKKVEMSFLIRRGNYCRKHLIGSVTDMAHDTDLIQMSSISDYKHTSQYLVWNQLAIGCCPLSLKVSHGTVIKNFELPSVFSIFSSYCYLRRNFCYF